MATPIRLLLVEDNPSDAELVLHELHRAGYDPITACVETEQDYRVQLKCNPEIILADYILPEFSAERALEILQDSRLDYPFIIVSGSIGEDIAVTAMKKGATDYIIKDRLGRLGQAVGSALEKKHLRDETHLASQRLLAQHAVTSILAESLTLDIAMSKILKVICQELDWAFGVFWQVDERESVLSCFECRSHPNDHFAEFEAITRQSVFARGVDFPGHLWNECKAIWIADFTPEFTYRQIPLAAKAGLRSVFGLPINHATNFKGILQFFHRENKLPNENTLQLMTDISIQIGLYIERHRAIDALRKSEERYRTLVAATTSIVWNTPASGEFEKEQVEWTAFTGQTFDHLRGWGWLNDVHPEDREKTARTWLAAVSERTTYEVEHRLRRADGVYRHMMVRGVPILETDGIVREWVGVHNDVTEQKNAAESLRRSEERFQELTKHIDQVLWIMDVKESKILYVSVGYEKMWGRSCQHLYENPLSFMEGIHPLDQEMMHRKNSDMFSNGHIDAECRVVRPDGSERWVWFRGYPVTENEKIVRIAGVIEDVSERRDAEATLRLRDRAIQAVTQGILITDPGQPDNPIVYVSPGFEQITGYASSDVLGRNCRFLQGQGTDPAAVAQIKEAIRNGKACRVELLNYRKDGTRFWNELSISTIHDDKGLLTHFVGVQSDVTARRSLEDQFRQIQKLEAVGKLAGGIAHDFNNLLTIINGYSELVLQGMSPSEPAHNLVGEILKAGQRSAGLTRQLLAFSRQQVLAPQILDLNELVKGAESMLRRLIGEDVRLTATLDSNLWAVRADPGQVEQVLMNLAVNARDAMPHGGRLTIESQNVKLDETYVRTHPDAHVGRHVLLSVTDDGTGMSPEVKTRLFEPFFTTKEAGHGTGLGLATVYGIVKQSGGHVAVYSEFGVGTTVKIYLPRTEQAKVDPKPTSGILTPPRGSETILLVEDDHAVRALTRHVLVEWGYTVLPAAEGDEAIRIAKGHNGPIRLIITDVVMPGSGGRVVAEKIVTRHPEAVVLFVSGYTDDAIVRHGVLSQGVNFLQKPYSPIDLAFKVRELLDAPAEIAVPDCQRLDNVAV